MATTNNSKNLFTVDSFGFRVADLKANAIDDFDDFRYYIKSIIAFVESCKSVGCFKPISMTFDFDEYAEIAYDSDECDNYDISSITFYEKNSKCSDDVTIFKL